jgi:N-acetylglucosamine malate deacetylase 1
MNAPTLDLLVLGAHPDDAEVHAGGLLALCALRGLRAGILDLTRGELGTRGTPETRKTEALEAARILGVERHFLDLPDSRFAEDDATRQALVAPLRALRPAVLVLPHPDDHHPDHHRAHRLGREAAYTAGLKNYPGPGGPWRAGAVAWVGGVNPPTPPDLVVDVSEVWARRMAAFDAFGSQFSTIEGQPRTRISSPTFRSGIVGRSQHWGSLLGVAHGEALWCDKPVPVALLDLLSRLR